MKQTLILTTSILTACCVHGQGTFQFDQGVSPTNAPGGYVNIQPDPTGESFVPTLSPIEIVQFYLSDGNPDQIGSTLLVDLWAGSLTSGVLLGQSAPVTVSGSFFGVTTFSFSGAVTLTPGDTYYLQPIIQSGDSEQIGLVPGVDYPNGMAFLSGTADPGGDLWFREGIVVPEPSSFSLAAFGMLGIYPVLRNRRT